MYLCWTVLLWTKLCFTWADTLTVKTVKCAVLKTHTRHKYILHSSEVRVWYVVPRKKILGPLYFEEKIRVENYPNLWTNSFLCWKIMNRIPGVTNVILQPRLRKRKQLFRKTSVIAFSVFACGHQHLQALQNLTSFCVEFTKKGLQK